ncbi:MAG: hypothetical protein JKX92_01410 [Porticoccaceae bacterium]|nr:hypothetical protein [Porticoccaceae bacterium]OUS06628.1 hypothetical protein A9Q90_05645 [Gammaproteobacteria bacterium 54_18_T64]
MSFSATELINNFDMYFDGSDMSNASLYLCIDTAVGDSGAQRIIAAMRAKELWSADAAKTVPAEHKPMYAEQMQFIGYVSGKVDGQAFHAAAYDHEKFPYNAARWQEWKNHIAATY